MVAMRDIRAFSRRIVDEFDPQQIILFGSHAHGRATGDSDVDLLVVFPGGGRVEDRSLEIRHRLRPPFAVDLLTRSREELEQRLSMNDWFLHDVTEQGIVLYDAADA